MTTSLTAHYVKKVEILKEPKSSSGGYDVVKILIFTESDEFMASHEVTLFASEKVNNGEISVSVTRQEKF